MNLLASPIVRSADRLRVLLGGGDFEIGEEALGGALATRLSEYQNVEVGVRPEHLTVSRGDGQGLRGVVRTREAIGETALLTIGAGAHRLRVLVPAEHRAREGEQVSLAPDLRRLHFFHPETGVRIDADPPP
jgi:multiple sugar transport system ATP-binding protein